LNNSCAFFRSWRCCWLPLQSITEKFRCGFQFHKKLNVNSLFTLAPQHFPTEGMKTSISEHVSTHTEQSYGAERCLMVTG
jgi:hypothetical protein